MTDIPKKPMGSETRLDLVFDSIADYLIERLDKRQGRRKRALNIEDAAEYLSLSEDAIRDLVAQHKLKATRPTRKLQFDIHDLDKLIEDSKCS